MIKIEDGYKQGNHQPKGEESEPLPAELGMKLEHVDEEIRSMAQALLNRAQQLQGADVLEGHPITLDAETVRNVLSGIYAAFERKKKAYLEANMQKVAGLIDAQILRLKSTLGRFDDLPSSTPVDKNVLENIKNLIEVELEEGDKL